MGQNIQSGKPTETEHRVQNLRFLRVSNSSPIELLHATTQKRKDIVYSILHANENTLLKDFELKFEMLVDEK